MSSDEEEEDVSEITVNPIGVVRSSVKQRSDMPTLGVPALIEVFDAYTAGLRHLEKHSHLWVLAWLHEAGRDKLLVTPRGVRDQGEAGLHGVFAVRSPTRPNPIGLSAVRIVAIEGNRIRVDRLDFVDGTPVIDMKPYFRRFDAIAAVRNEPIGRPASRDAALAALLIEAENFHGERCGGLALAARIVEHARSVLFNYRDPPGLKVIAPQARGCLIDTLMALFNVGFGRGTFGLHDRDAVILAHGLRRYVYTLIIPPSRSFEDVLAAAESSVFQFHSFDESHSGGERDPRPLRSAHE